MKEGSYEKLAFVEMLNVEQIFMKTLHAFRSFPQAQNSIIPPRPPPNENPFLILQNVTIFDSLS